MSADNVAEIGGATPKRQRRPAERFARFRDPEDGPGTLRLTQAMRGAACALEQLVVDQSAGSRDDDVVIGLSTATAILAEMLADRHAR